MEANQHNNDPLLTFQDIILKLDHFWSAHNCVLHHSYDSEVGAGTFHPATFIRSLGPEPYRAAYTQASRRPTDGRYGENPNRLQRYFQYQVILKPVPPQFLSLYFQSLAHLGIKGTHHDIRLVHDDWQSPTLGAKGLGWEVWLSGMEITQLTYFQQIAGLGLPLITGEITYGLERIALFLQRVSSVYDIQYNKTLTYGDIYKSNEIAHSHYNFDLANTKTLFQLFSLYETEAERLFAKDPKDFQDSKDSKDVNDSADSKHAKTSGNSEDSKDTGNSEDSKDTGNSEDSKDAGDSGDSQDIKVDLKSIALPSYDMVIKCSHIFNLLDARSAISAIERETYISRIRSLAKRVAEAYLSERKKLGYPLEKYLKAFSPSIHSTLKESQAPQTTLSASKVRELTKAPKLLFELGVEELPHEIIEKAEIRLKDLFEKNLSDFLATSKDLKLFSTPRRLAILADLTILADSGYLERIAKALKKVLEQLTVKKSKLGETMRWGTTDENEKTFPRPITYLTILLGDTPIVLTHAGITSGTTTRGHRWLTHYQNSQNSQDSHTEKKDQASKQPTVTKEDDYCGALLNIPHSTEWEGILEKNHVIADREKRQDRIRRSLSSLAEEHNWEFVSHDKLLPIVTQLVEYPETIVGDFDKEFLKLPEEVIISEMVEHQKYFPIRDRKTQKLLPKFIITSNIPPPKPSDSAAPNDATVNAVKIGNERVLTARLRDGLFFYEQDLKVGLPQLYNRLENITFYEPLGTYTDRVERLKKVLLYCNDHLEFGYKEEVLTTLAQFAKADLASLMVGEFPKLQGVIGHYYAKHELKNNSQHYKRYFKLEDDEQYSMLVTQITRAIKGQYIPFEYWREEKFNKKARLQRLLCIADSLTDIISFFAVGVKATGSEDPKGLRRSASELAKVLGPSVASPQSYLELASFSLKEFWEDNAYLYEPFLAKHPEKLTADALFEKLVAFLNTRLENVLRKDFPDFINSSEQRAKILPSMLKAVLLDDDWNPGWYTKLLVFLDEFMEEEPEKLTAIQHVYKRIANTLKPNRKLIVQLVAQPPNTREINENLFEKSEEKALFEHYKKTDKMLSSIHSARRGGKKKSLLMYHNFLPVIDCFHDYKKPLENFFEQVMVNVEDVALKRNRLVLLILIQRQLDSLLKWSELPIEDLEKI